MPSSPPRPGRPWRAFLAALVGTIVSLAPAIARAIEYEIFIDVDAEEELYDLLLAEQISETTFENLLEIYRRGVDLNTASRTELYALPNLTYDEVDAILAYREDVGWITEPADLVRAGVLSERKMASIAMFIVIRQPGRALAATNGFARYSTAWTQRDTRVPPMAMQARISTLRQLTIGAAGLVTRNRVGSPAWDPNRGALSAEPAGTQFHAPKYFAQWDTEKWGVIAGTYRIGFGQRLVFDNSGRYTPNGFYLDDALFWRTDLTRLCNESAGELAESPCTGPDGLEYVTPDWRWRDGNRGVAAGAKHLELPTGWLQLYGFFSHERKDIYQYEIWNRDTCDDPNRDDDDRCSAPQVFVRRDDPLEPTSRHSFQVLPDMYDELLGGANVSYFYNRRTHVGVTGYGSDVRWRVEGADLDFQEWSRTPYGGPFGAFGTDAAWGKGWADIFLEVAGTVSSQPRVVADDERDSEAGLGTILRHTATWKNNEIEVVGRYYGQQFNNPYARPIAAPDEFEGQRARDEAGGRIRYTSRLADRVDLRSSLDVWVQPNEEGSVRELPGSSVADGPRPKMLAFVRADVDATKRLRPGLWLQYQDRDLRVFRNSDNCYEIDPNRETVEGEPILCAGQQFQIFGRLRYQAHERVVLSAQYQHRWLDDPTRGGGFGNPDPERARQDMSTWLALSSQPVDGWRLRARFRFLFQDVSRRDRLEESLWVYLDTSYTFRWLVTRLRYDVRGFIDERDATANRLPGCLTGPSFCANNGPEHWLRLELEARF